MIGQRLFMAGILSVILPGPTAAQDQSSPGITAEEFEARLGYETGTINLTGGMATIRLPETFRFLGPEGSRRLLTQAWGNPEDAADGVLGMLIPASISPLSDEGWGIVITYERDGYVNDEDAATIDYDKLLEQLQEGAKEENRAREKQGYEPVTVVGWAEPPSYDAESHKMYWAQELEFGDEPEHTLNYGIRILGRRGVLVLNAVAGMPQLDAIRGETQDLLAAVEFNEGHRYTDFLPGTDKVAEYGLAGLVVGAVAAKAGLFKLLLAGLIALKKVIVVAALAVAAAARRLFRRGKPAEEPEARSM